MSDDVKNLLESGLKAVRESLDSKTANTQEEINKQNAIIKDLEEKAIEAQKSFEAQKIKEKELEEKAAKMQAEIEALYKTGNRASYAAGDNELKSHFEQYEKEMDTYLRKGIAPSSETLSQIAKHTAELVVKKGSDYDKEMATRYFSSDQGEGSGFYSSEFLKAHVVGNDADGGYLVYPDVRNDFRVGRNFETSPMRAISRVITTNNASVEVLIDDQEATSGGWVGEIQSRTDTGTAQVGKLTIVAHEQFAQPKVSQSMLDDASINVEQFIAEKTNDILTRTENTAFVIGDGSQKPKGFLDYAVSASAAYERNALQRVNSGTDGAITADGLIGLQSALKEVYQTNATFLTKRASFGDIMKLKNGQGDYLLNMSMLSDGVPMQLLGRPLLFADDMPTVASAAEPVAYGDFGVGYTIVDRFGIRTLRDPFTDKPNVRFYSTKRVGGDVTNFEAIKILKLSV